MRLFKSALIILIVSVLLPLASGCGPGAVDATGSGGGSVIGPGSGITVTANPTAMSTSGVGVISADVRDTSGNPVPDGTLVTFTLSSPAMGTLSSATATTTGGIAQVTLTANTITGSLLITAASGTDTGFVVVTISASPPTNMSLSGPALLTIGASSNITAHVVDAIGNPVANEVVTFGLSNGLYGSLSSPTGVTDAAGDAIVSFTAGSTSAVVTVSATSGSLSASLDITISGGLAGGSITVNASPTALTYLATSTITATLLDSGSNPVTGATVSFTLADPTLGTLNIATATTDALGVATVAFTAASITGTETITASALSLSGSALVTITPPTGLGSLTISATPTSMLTSASSAITVQVLGAGGGPFSGAVVDFTLSNPAAGNLTSATATTGVTGIATNTFTALNLPTSVVLTASTTTPSLLSATTTLTITVPPPASISALIPNPAAILVRGTSTITATVLDASGNPVPDGAVVTFSLSDATLGTLTSTSTTTANSNGTASTTFLASNKPGVVSITAVAGSASATTTVAIAPADTASIEFVSAIPQAVGIQGSGQQETSAVRFLVNDVNGDPVADGTAVTFTMIGPGGGEYIIGSIVGGTVATSSTINGQASVTLHSGTVAGPVTIIGTTYVNSNDQTSLPAAINPTDTTIPVAVGGTSGFPASGIIKIESEFIRYAGIVGDSFTGCTRGEFGTVNAGHAAATQVFGQSTISTSASQISIGGGVPSGTHFTLATLEFNLEGIKTCGLNTTITAYIADRFGNYNVLQGTQVNYYAESGGAINSSTPTDAGGKSTATVQTCPGAIEDVKNTVATTAPPQAGFDSDYPDFAQYFLGSNEPYRLGQAYNYNPRDGWVTFLATTMGEEGFLDENGNGLFTRSWVDGACPAGYTCECDGGNTNGYSSSIDPADLVRTCPGAPAELRSEGFTDRGEPYYDLNDNGRRDDTTKIAQGYPYEQFIDADGSGGYNLPNSVWDGPECDDSNSPCLKSKMIWENIQLVFTGDHYYYPNPDANRCYSTVAPCAATYGGGDFAIAPASILKGSSGSFCLIVADINLNRPPGGTVLAASASPGTVAPPSSVTLFDVLSIGPSMFCFTVNIDASEPANSTSVSVTVGSTGLPAIVTVPLSTPPLSVATAAVPSGLVGVPYNTSLAATGGIPPYIDWVVTAGALPAGLTLNSSGTISGSPAGPAGTSNFTVRVTDSAANTATRALSLTIN